MSYCNCMNLDQYKTSHLSTIILFFRFISYVCVCVCVYAVIRSVLNESPGPCISVSSLMTE